MTIKITQSTLKKIVLESVKKAMVYESSTMATDIDKIYMDAVNRGDIDTAQRMVIKAAKAAMPNTKVVDENGNPRIMYHGTPKKFNTFDREKIKRGYGFWFTQDDFEADNYSYPEEEGDEPRNMAVFLNSTNPATLEDVNGKLLDDFIKKIGAKVSPKVFIHDRQATDFLRSRGYDGLIFGNKAIVYSPNQIKSADPVAYDDNGNVIPISKRFMLQMNDIRYEE